MRDLKFKYRTIPYELEERGGYYHVVIPEDNSPLVSLPSSHAGKTLEAAKAFVERTIEDSFIPSDNERCNIYSAASDLKDYKKLSGLYEACFEPLPVRSYKDYTLYPEKYGKFQYRVTIQTPHKDSKLYQNLKRDRIFIGRCIENTISEAINNAKTLVDEHIEMVEGEV